MATSIGNDYPEVYFKQGSCDIILKKGDLMNEKDVDVIVIPTPEYGRQAAQTYPLFELLRSKANPNLKGQINTCSSNIRQGGAPQIIFTVKPAIILTPTPYFQNEKRAIQMLKDTYFACLNLAMGEKCQTIAFPTIGCGQSGFSTQDGAKTLYNALVQFEQSRNKQLKEIRIVVFKEEIYNEFTNVFMELGRDRNAKIKFVDMYELLHNKLCFALDFRIVYLSDVHFILMFILDHRKSRDQPKCHRKGMKNQHHNETLTKKIRRSNDY
jgi:O-acetyl-ADP-ribose deacetylase (regulator of RNase III)